MAVTIAVMYSIQGKLNNKEVHLNQFYSVGILSAIIIIVWIYALRVARLLKTNI